MKPLRIVVSVCLFLLAACAAMHPVLAAAPQNAGDLAPWAMPVFPNASGSAPLANGFVCTYAAGTTTPQSPYQDKDDTTPHHNPIQLNSAGRPITWGGSTELPIYMDGLSYKFVLYGPGSGNTCNGTTVGTLIKTMDNIQDLAVAYQTAFATKMDDKVCHPSKQTGTSPNNWGGKVAACITALASTGGVVDARGLQGAQAISATVTASKPVTIVFDPGASITCTASGSCFSGTISLECGGATISSSVANSGISPSSGTRVHNCIFVGHNVSDSTSFAVNGGSTVGFESRGNIYRQWGAGCIDTGANSSNWTFSGDTFDRCVQDGVFITSSTTSSGVYDSIFTSNGNNDIDFNGTGLVATGNRHFFSGTAAGGSDCEGVLVAPVSGNSGDAIVSNNYFYKPNCRAVDVKSTPATTVHNVQVRGNTAISPLVDCYGIDGSVAGTMDTVQVVHNLCHGPARHGIAVDASAGTAQNITVAFNEVDGDTNVAGYALLVAGPHTANIQTMFNDLSNGNTNKILFSGGGASPNSFCNIQQATDLNCYANALALGISTGTGRYGMLDVRSGSTGADGIFLGQTANAWLLTEEASGDFSIRQTASGTPTTGDQLTVGLNTGNLTALGAVLFAGNTPTAAVGYVGLGTTNGFGAGASGTAVTTTTKAAGAGPTTAQTIVKYLKINISGTDYWVPLMQ